MRRAQARPRRLQPDFIYSDLLVTKLIGRAMKDGKKSVAQTQIYNALETVKEKTGEDPIFVFHRALDNIRPTMEVRPRRIGGAAYQVPMAVRGVRRDSLAIRWLIESSRRRSNSEFHTYGLKLAAEIIDASKGEGMAVKKRVDMEKVAESNKAFSHFKW